MMAARLRSFEPDMRGIAGSLAAGEPMSRHTTWRVGGPAEWYFRPAGRDDLVAFLVRLPESVPVTFVGLGSNLLVRDGGIRGVVVATHKALSGLRVEAGGRVYAEAGVASAQVARFSNRRGLTGAEFLAGIPGCIGGALAMNAGAFGSQTWEVVESAELVSRDGSVVSLPAAGFEVGYRRVALPADSWFLSATLVLGAGDVEAGRARIAELLRKRSASQPVQSANAGSVFTNPEGDFAGRLIESCGLKGFALGGARVSEKHANFILNDGDATAADVERLIEHVRETVAARHGVLLRPEVRVLGEPR